MSYSFLSGADLTGLTGAVIKSATAIDQTLDGPGNMTLRMRAAAEPGEPFVLTCNTISSPTFGGTVRAVRNVKPRAGGGLAYYDVDVDDWTPMFDRARPMRAYSSVAADSIIRDLVTFATSFTANGVSSMKSEAGSLTWDRLTVSFAQDVPLSHAINSVVGMCAPVVATDPPWWWIDPTRDVQLVGQMSSIGRVITDADADCVSLDVTLNVASLVTRVFVWCGSTAAGITGAAAGATTIPVNDSSRWAQMGSLVGDNALYAWVSSTNELVQVHSVINATNLHTNSLAWNTGAQHQAVPSAATMRAVVFVQSLVSQAVIGSIVGGSGVYDTRVDVASLGIDNAASVGQPIGNSLLTTRSTAVAAVTLRTYNSLAMPGAILSVNSLAYGGGEYFIRRVSIAGFDRGENVRPIYTVEAGPERQPRLEDTL